MFSREQFDFQKILRWFVREEVKTPLAFFFKVVPYMVAAWIAILYAPINDSMKHSLFKFSALILLVLFVLVWLFAFFRPRHLVYGEAGHRAERRLELGTEKKTFTDIELAQLPAIKNPAQLPSQREIPE
jgi:hypothetical protein